MSPTETDLEPRLRDALRAKAEQIPVVDERFDPDVITLDEGSKPSRGAAWLVAAAVLVLVVVVLGFVVLQSNDDRGTTQVPAGEPEPHYVGRVVVESLPELRYQAKEFTTAPGLNEIVFMNAGGTHDLVFADPAIAAGLRLFSSSSGNGATAEVRGSVQLEAGKDYVISCSIPGHRDAGEIAVIHVTG